MIVWWLAACGFSEDRFLVKGIERWCEASSECSGTFETQSCIDVMRSQDRSGCDYDAEAAADCYEALETAGCDDDPLLDLAVLVVPEACDAVYVCGSEE